MLKGQAKTAYMRAYMQRQGAGQPTKCVTTAADAIAEHRDPPAVVAGLPRELSEQPRIRPAKPEEYGSVLIVGGQSPGG